jgi:predicted Fe-Mo cluster-binding NifX family protein
LFNDWPTKDESMKIAVASVAPKEISEISPRSGRSKFFLIFDGAGNLLEVLSNPFCRGGGGAGFGAAKMLVDKGVNIVVGSRIGQHMGEALKIRRVKYYAMTGNAKNAVV